MTLTFALAAALCHAALAAEGAPAAASGAVGGFVFDGPTGLPLAGVTVSVGGVRAITDAWGAFRLDVDPGTVTLVLEAGQQRLEVPGVVVERGFISEVLVTLDGGRLVELAAEMPEAGSGVQETFTGVPGTLRGAVRHADEGSPLAGVRVFVRGSDAEATTAEDGTFQVDLPPGTWELTLLRAGFSTQTVRDVVVVSEQTTSIDVDLTPAGLMLADFVVRSPRIEGGTSELLEERRTAGTVMEVIGAEQMSKSGDSDAASALSRVTGLTLVDGKYVYVRGMGERYSTTLFDGTSIPSPEPERRVVPLDMFPTNLLDSVVIQKTFSPDMPAEFGGGVVSLRTRSVPEERLAQVSLTGKYTAGTTFATGLAAASGPTDWLGFDGTYRDLPAEVEAASAEGFYETDRFTEGYSAEELEAFGEAIANRWVLLPRQLGPGISGNAAVGDGYHKGEFGAGWMVGAVYSYDWDFDEYRSVNWQVDDLLGDYQVSATELEVKLGGIVNTAFTWGEDHTVRLTSVLVRVSSNAGVFKEGYFDDAGNDVRWSRSEYVERQVWFTRLAGEHTLPWADLGVAWHYAPSTAGLDAPDRREYRFDYEEANDTWRLSNRPEGNQITYLALADQNHDVGADLTLPFTWRDSLETPLDVAVKAGVSLVLKDRVVDARRYKFYHKGPLSSAEEVLTQEIDQILVPENIGADGFQFGEFTQATDNYFASQRLLGAYLMADAGLTPQLRVLGGARVERSLQEVTTFDRFTTDLEPIVATLDNLDLLPALVATWSFSDSLLLRGGYGRTLNRPVFRELSPATNYDVESGYVTKGNAELSRALIDNFDLRWEWYPDAGELVSLSAFYKRFTSPIEVAFEATAAATLTYVNADTARNFGSELELRKGLGFVADALTDVFVAGNLALIQSRVEYGDTTAFVQTSLERPLQGQSPWVVNLQVGYDGPESGTTVTALYNVFGPRITEVGTSGLEDLYQLPQHRLDFVASQQLPRGFKARLKVANVLRSPEKIVTGDRVAKDEVTDLAVSVGVSWGL